MKKIIRNIYISMAIILAGISSSMCAGIIEGKLTHNFTQEDIAAIGVELKNAMPVLGKELQDAAQAFAKEVSKDAPEIAHQIKIMAHPLKTLPLNGIGLATAIAGIALLYKSIDSYCSWEIENANKSVDHQKKYKHATIKRGIFGLVLIAASIASIVKSDTLVNQLA